MKYMSHLLKKIMECVKFTVVVVLKIIYDNKELSRNKSLNENLLHTEVMIFSK